MPTLPKERRASPAIALGAPIRAGGDLLRQRELVQRIVASPTFARSERLSSLLLHVCEMTFTGREGELNENRIGQAVFGRSPEYDSSADGIVRTQASRLRQRLDLFFKQEGCDEGMQLTIPKGGYVPVFQPRPAMPEDALPLLQGLDRNAIRDGDTTGSPGQAGDLVPATVSGTDAAHGRSHGRREGVVWVLSLLCLVLAGALVAERLWHRAEAPHASAPVHPLWDQLLRPGHTTLEVPGDSGLVLTHLVDKQGVPLEEYLSGSFRQRAHVPGGVSAQPLEDFRERVARARYTSTVDLAIALDLKSLATERHATLQVRYARDLRPNDLKNKDVILVGAQEANPWVELFEQQMNFVLQDDYEGSFAVLNRKPRSGEPSRWVSRQDDPAHHVYGVVALLPNLSGTGQVLLIEGTSMAGTEAAWDFISDDGRLLPFLRGIRRRDGSLPSFEVLVGTQNIGASAVQDEFIAWRLV